MYGNERRRNDESEDIESETEDQRCLDAELCQEWEPDQKEYGEEWDIARYFRGNDAVFISTTEFLEGSLQKWTRCSWRKRSRSDRHTECTEGKCPEIICYEIKERWGEEEDLCDDERIFLSPEIGDESWWYLEEHRPDIANPRIESDLIRVRIRKGQIVDREYRDKMPTIRQNDEEVLPEIGRDSGGEHYFRRGLISSSATAEIEFFGEPSMSLSE